MEKTFQKKALPTHFHIVAKKCAELCPWNHQISRLIWRRNTKGRGEKRICRYFQPRDVCFNLCFSFFLLTPVSLSLIPWTLLEAIPRNLIWKEFATSRYYQGLGWLVGFFLSFFLLVGGRGANEKQMFVE